MVNEVNSLPTCFDFLAHIGADYKPERVGDAHGELANPLNSPPRGTALTLPSTINSIAPFTLSALAQNATSPLEFNLTQICAKSVTLGETWI